MSECVERKGCAAASPLKLPAEILCERRKDSAAAAAHFIPAEMLEIYICHFPLKSRQRLAGANFQPHHSSLASVRLLL